MIFFANALVFNLDCDRTWTACFHLILKEICVPICCSYALKRVSEHHFRIPWSLLVGCYFKF